MSSLLQHNSKRNMKYRSTRYHLPLDRSIRDLAVPPGNTTHIKSIYNSKKKKKKKEASSAAYSVLTTNDAAKDLDTDRSIARSRKNIEFDSTGRPQETPRKERNERNKGRPTEEGRYRDDYINSQLARERQREGLKHDCERRVTSVAETSL